MLSFWAHTVYLANSIVVKSQNWNQIPKLQLWHDVLSNLKPNSKVKGPILQGKCLSNWLISWQFGLEPHSQNCSPFCMILLVAHSVFLKNKSLRRILQIWCWQILIKLVPNCRLSYADWLIPLSSYHGPRPSKELI